MRIALIARMDRTGLGYQTKALFDMLRPAKTLVIGSKPFNGNEQNMEWFYTGDPDRFTAYTEGFPTTEAVSWLLTDVDIVITCEVPYHDALYAIARERGIKTVLQPNAELNPHFRHKELDLPDYFFLPSTWYEKETRQLGVTTVVCPPPIALEADFKEIEKEIGTVKVLHIAGKRALADRNGTDIVKKALKDFPGVELTIREQSAEDFKEQKDMYSGDFHIVLMPRRYGGLCLPMYEALSQGLPVLMSDIEPNRTVLPPEWLMRARNYREIMTKRLIKAYQTDTLHLQDAVARFRAMDQEQYDKERHKAVAVFSDYQSDLSLWEFYLNRIMEGKL